MNRLIIIGIVLLVAVSCRKDPEPQGYQPTPYDLEIPTGFPEMIIPADNPLTEEGVELGRRLFYDERLSGDNTMACASCHMPAAGFGENIAVSTGIDGIAGTRNSMPLFNIGWAPQYFWDGRATTLEEQILEPINNPIELHDNWVGVAQELEEDALYPSMFAKAFGSSDIDSVRITKAIAQFLRTMISADSRFDQWLRGELVLTPQEFQGLSEFNSLTGADCFHCHPTSVGLFTDFTFRNNGLKAAGDITDPGRQAVTGSSHPKQFGAMKVPSLRNLAFTAPYMHDGSLQTIDDVIEFYSHEVNDGPHTDLLMEFSSQGGVQLNATQKANLKAFLLTLTDSSFITNPDFQDPGY